MGWRLFPECFVLEIHSSLLLVAIVCRYLCSENKSTFQDTENKSYLEVRYGFMLELPQLPRVEIGRRNIVSVT